MGESTLPIKKSVELYWQGQALAFDVAQDLFSSFQIDRGSRMLLDSLDPAAFAATGAAADFGCGYGVLGIAWQAAMPGWSMRYVDRDALAVAFSAHNARRLVSHAGERAAFSCDITLPVDEGGYDLALWNVPGKAGRPVLAGLRNAVLDTLARGGVLALVVVHPLAELFTGPPGRDDVEVTRVEPGREHTVVHMRRVSGEPVTGDPFARGLFDRHRRRFEAAGLAWELTPVTGLPEYDSLDHATDLAIRAMAAVAPPGAVERWMVLEPGAGHLACAAARLWPDARGRVHGRDALAIRSTVRALGGAGIDASPLWGAEAIEQRDPVDVIVSALPEQAQSDDLAMLIDALGRHLGAGGALIAHGRSTEVGRLERLARKASAWRVGKPEKLRGSAAVTLRHRLP